MAEHELLILVVDAGADPGRLSEIERRSLHRPELAGRNQILVHRSETVGVEHNFVIQNVAVTFPRKVEVTVLAEVDGGGLVGSGFVIDDEFVGVGQRVGDSHLEITGPAVVAIFTQISECHARVALQRFAVPDNFVERLFGAAVQRVGPVIFRQSVGFAVEGEGAVGDAVGIAADNSAQERRIRNVALQVLVAENDVGKLAFAVGDANRNNDAAIVHRIDFDSVGVRERVQGDGPPILRAKRFLLNGLLMSSAGLRSGESADCQAVHYDYAYGLEMSWRHAGKCTTSTQFVACGCSVRPLPVLDRQNSRASLDWIARAGCPRTGITSYRATALS